MLRSLALLLGLVLLAGCGEAPSRLPDADIAENNRGVALMGQYRYEDARQVFAGLAERHAGRSEFVLNLAIATLNRQQEGDEARAAELVRSVLAREPAHARARYLEALIALHGGDADAALAGFEAVAAADPDDAHAAYFAGQAAQQLGRTEDAIAWYRRAIERDPYLRSAYYGAALALRRSGVPEEARAMLDAYQRFENNPRAELAEFRYTRMGPKAEAQPIDPPAPEQPAAPDGPLFAAPRTLAPAAAVDAGQAGALTVADIDGDGLLDLHLAAGAMDGASDGATDGATGSTTGSRVWLQRDDGFVADDGHALAGIDAVAALWGDVDNDGRPDVYLCRRGGDRLLLQQEAGWTDVTEAAGLGAPADCRDGALFDADHDGDLDVYLVHGDGANELYNNNLDGSFRRLAADAGIGGGERASRQVLPADLDGDRDVDLVVLHAEPPHEVFLNDRLWRYQPAPDAQALAAAPLRALTAADIDADGQLELVGIDDAGALSLWRRDPQRGWSARTLGSVDAAGTDARVALAALDLDGDGAPELLVQHGAGTEVLSLPAEGTADTLQRIEAPLQAAAPLLLDAARGPALVGLVQDGTQAALRLWPAGPGRFGFLAIAPRGRTESGQSMRSNASGIGTALVVRTGARWSVLDSHDRHSAPGQSLQPVAVGLAGAARADYVELLWTDGVYQTELAPAAGALHTIAEEQRQLASCPVLFAWDGQRQVFVSDVLGVGGIGFLLAPGQYAEPRPWEFFRLPDGLPQPREGRYAIKIGEPMEEIAYLDQARLHVHDLPPGWSLALDERMHTGGGPAPTGAPVFYRDASLLLPRHAAHDGRDVTARLTAADHDAVPPGAVDPRFLGRLAASHVLTLEFGQVINPPGSRPVLLADGWVEYPYSQTLFAAWQAGAAYEAPTLEARGADGRWQVVYEQFGYPAGMPREMTLPLAGLPPGTDALRLRSNLEIYWDRIAVVHAQDAPSGARHRVLEVAEARVGKPGFARRDELPQRRPHYDYEDRAPFWDTRHAPGAYTALGPATALVAAHDDALAVIGPGEEVHIEFDAPAPVPPGWRRSIVLEARGWAKDMDMYTRDGERVEPLPRTPGSTGSAARDALHATTLTRFQGGR